MELQSIWTYWRAWMELRIVFYPFTLLAAEQLHPTVYEDLYIIWGSSAFFFYWDPCDTFTFLRFPPVSFLERVRDFLLTAGCVFGSIDFNGNASKMHVLYLQIKCMYMHFECVFGKVLYSMLLLQINASALKNASKTHYKIALKIGSSHSCTSVNLT